MTLAIRAEVFGAVLPHEAAAACAGDFSNFDAQLRVEDVFAVIDDLRGPQRAAACDQALDETTYSTWLATAWLVLRCPLA